LDTLNGERQQTKVDNLWNGNQRGRYQVGDQKKTLDRWHTTRLRQIGNCKLRRIGTRSWKFESIDSFGEKSYRVMKPYIMMMMHHKVK